MDNEKAIRAAKLTLGGILEKRRAKTAVERAQGQIAPSKYLPDVPRQVHADGGRVYPLDDRSGWYGDANYEQTGGKLVMMSPDEYLSKVRPLDIDDASRDNIDDLKRHILSGRKLDPLKIDAQNREDGRHRAHAARELGIKQVPVLTWPREGRASGGYVPTASLPIPKLAVATPLAVGQQPGLLDVIGTLNKVAGSARTISDLVRPEREEAAPEPQAARAEAKAEGLTPEASAAMEALRKGWTGQDFGIVSGYRDPEHNERVGGAKNSQHIHGNAFDVNTTGWSPEDKLALADAAWDAGFRGFGFYDNNMHFDVADPRAWGPSYSRDSIPDWAQGWAQERYGYAEGGEVTDLGQVREQKQLQTYHTGMMDDIHQRMSNAMQAHEKAVDQGVFDGYEVGDMLQGSAHPMRITGRYMQKWKPTPFAMRSFERMGTQPTIIEHEGEQYIPMLRYQTGKEGMEGWQEGSAYLDGIKAAGYQKMGGLRAVKATGGSVYTPQKTVKAYKLFRTKDDGKLYPLFVHADKPVPMGEWLEAEEGPQGKAEGKVKSKLGDLAYRPGWHAGDLPMATHIGGKSDPSLKKPDYRPDNHVWAEVEMAADKDWQSVADSRGKGVKAHITDQVPYGGFYRYKTNPNMTGNWLIGGHMKVNRVLPDEEVKAINDAAGTADLPRRSEGFAAGGAAMFEGIHEDLQDEHGNPLELWHGTPSEPFDEFKDEKLGSTRDYGFYGRGHYLTPDRENAEEYTTNEYEKPGTVMGPLHAALKNPYIWDTSEQGSHRTLRDLQSMGIMKGQDRLEPWDNLQGHHIRPFMDEMKKRGHDGVIMKTGRGVQEIVVFKPSAIKHKDAERFDPNDPNIYHARGGVAK